MQGPYIPSLFDNVTERLVGILSECRDATYTEPIFFPKLRQVVHILIKKKKGK